jgi:hypothetical protein
MKIGEGAQRVRGVEGNCLFSKYFTNAVSDPMYQRRAYAYPKLGVNTNRYRPKDFLLSYYPLDERRTIVAGS